MSADGKNCECGRLAVANLRWRGQLLGEPICAECLKQLAPGFVMMKPALPVAPVEAACA